MISSFDFRHTKKPPHDITNGKGGISLLSNIVMLCNGFEIQNLCCMHQPRKAAYARRRSALYHRLTFKRIALCDFQFSSNSLSGILEYHSGDMAVKILRKLFNIPCGQSFYSSALKIG